MTTPGVEEYRARWSAGHGGVDTTRAGPVRSWLGVVYVLARPFVAARVPPDVVTLLGLLAALAVVPLAAAGGRWPLLVALVVLVSAALDGVDGAVALLTDRATPWGAVLDAVADRVGDLAFAVALLALGGWQDGPVLRWLAAAAGALALLHEYVRARAAQAGLPDVGVVTVAERPTRVAVTVMFCLAAGLFPTEAGWWGGLGLVTWFSAAVVGLAHLLVVLRSRLR